MTVLDYAMMVEDSHVETRIVEYRRRGPDSSINGRGAGELLAVALTDVLGDGLSMVYSYFDSDQPMRSLGTFMILDHIARARRMGLPYVYLGYWVQGSRKMDYKGRFLPQQRLTSDGWKRVERVDRRRSTASARTIMTAHRTPKTVLADLWRAAGQPAEALDAVELTGAEPVLPVLVRGRHAGANHHRRRGTRRRRTVAPAHRTAAARQRRHARCGDRIPQRALPARRRQAAPEIHRDPIHGHLSLPRRPLGPHPQPISRITATAC